MSFDSSDFPALKIDKRARLGAVVTKDVMKFRSHPRYPRQRRMNRNFVDGLATDAILGLWKQDQLHSSCFTRMMLVARIAAQRVRSANLKTREKHHELQNEVGSWDTHGFGDVGAYICDSTRRCATRRTIGSVSFNGWSVGDLRFALRETEIS
jgi:hypothetical protein